MKKIWKYFLMLLSFSANAQINLVPNPSFEDTIQCPAFPQPTINYALYWSSYGSTSDYFNSCANNNMFWGVPNNVTGFQNAKLGNAYAGFVTWCNSPNLREYLGVQLMSPLEIGTKYFVSFYVSNADSANASGGNNNSSTNNVGLKFSNVLYTYTDQAPIDNISHVHADSIITDKINWTRIRGTYIADSAYQYLILGNFYDDFNTSVDTMHPVSFNCAYYYIDAVCVSTDSLYDASWIGLGEFNQDYKLAIFPNPSSNFISINNEKYFKEVFITNCLGIQVKEEKLNSGLNQINISSLAAGIYLLDFDRKYYCKLIVQR
jgi:hypothetical protein